MKTSSTSMLFFALTALLITACQQEEPHKNGGTREVVTYTVKAEPLQQQIQAVGTAKANEAIDITAKVAGRLEKILFRDGQEVEKGQILAQLDQDEELAQLASARIQLAEHQREIKRLNSLLERHAAPVRDLDERKTLVAVTANDIKAIEARLHELTLKAPFTGKVGIRHVSPGALIQPGTLITTLDQADPIKLDFTIPATRLQAAKVGAKIEAVTDALPNTVFSGEVTAIDSRINPVSRTILVRANLDNRDKLLIPGMLLTITLLQPQRLALVVPEESVTQKQDKHFITLVNSEQTAELRAVEIGQRFYGYVEIVNGLTAGEHVIVRGMEFVKPGSTVKVSEVWDEIKNGQFPAQQAQPSSTGK